MIAVVMVRGYIRTVKSFNGGYSPEELRKKAEAEKVRRLAEAESAIAPLARAVKLKIATDEEIKRLEAWELYSVMVNRVDTSAPDWPDIPR